MDDEAERDPEPPARAEKRRENHRERVRQYNAAVREAKPFRALQMYTLFAVSHTLTRNTSGRCGSG
jgi:hypothetical protein